MIRLTRCLLPFAKTIVFPPRNVFYNAPKFFFAFSNSAKVMHMIEQQSKEENLSKLCIEISVLPDEAKEKAIDAVLDKIKTGKFSPAAIIHDKFNIHLKKYPKLQYEAYEFRIIESLHQLTDFILADEEKGQKMVIKDVNDSFGICFQAIKKMSPSQAIKPQVNLYRLFAYYHNTLLIDVVSEDKKDLVRDKALEYYLHSVQKMFILLREPINLPNYQGSDLTIQEKAVIDQQKQTLMDERFQMIEEQADSLSEVYRMEQVKKVIRHESSRQSFVEQAVQKKRKEREKEKQEKKQQEKLQGIQGQQQAKQQQKIEEKKQQKQEEQEEQEEQQQQIKEQDLEFDMDKVNQQHEKDTKTDAQVALKLEPFFVQTIEMYEQYPEKLPYSLKYHQIKSTLIEIIGIREKQAIREADLGQEEKQQKILQVSLGVKQQMKIFYEKGLNNFKYFLTTEPDADEIQEFAFVLLSSQTQTWQTKKEITDQDVKELGRKIQRIMDCVEDRKMRLTVLKAIIKGMKEGFGIDFSPYVEKIPRSLRLSNSRRSIQEDDELML